MEQLYARGNPICPETNYERDDAAKKIKALENRTEQIQGIIDEIVDRVTNRLLERAEIAEWARQAVKPSYTAEEVGADVAGSAQNALLEAKKYSDSTYQQLTAYTNQKIAELTGGADDTLDTLGEIADAIRNNEMVVNALHNAIGNKASDVELQAHISNGTVHVTSGEKSGWNDAVAKIDGIKEKLDGIEDGANRLTTTTSLLATEPGIALDATAAPVIMQKIDSQNSDFAKSVDEINSNLTIRLAGKQDAATAINTSNIGNQSVNHANSAGSADSVPWSGVTGRPGLTGIVTTVNTETKQITINASSIISIELPFAVPSGYLAIGVVGVNANTASSAITRFMIVNSSVRIELRNTTTGQQTITISATVLCKNNSLL